MDTAIEPRPKAAEPAAAILQEATALEGLLRAEFETPFRFLDASTGQTIGLNAEKDEPDDLEPPLNLSTVARAEVTLIPGARYRIAIPIEISGGGHLVALGVIAGLARTPAETSRERSRLERWSRSVQDRIEGAREARIRHQSRAEHDRQSMVAWEAMIALDRLNRGARIHREPNRERQRILRAAAELVGAQTMAWVPVQNDEDVILEGDRLLSPWDGNRLANLLSAQSDWEESGYLLINEVSQASWGARFPQVDHLLAVPVTDRKLAGWVLALNRRRSAPRNPASREPRLPRSAVRESPETGPSPGFRRSDAALLLPFASLIGLQSRASRRYLHIKDLLVGLTRSLTAAIDAKDAYTYGHSERVARAAVELGRELGLQEDELSDIYLTGLLHDIGKIGVRDEVLTKRGPLTDEEFKHIQQHVVIGHRILAGLSAIEHLLPGVLYHHERYDGKGYPEGLQGDAIPLLARILAVADSFDAMSTSRPYRTAMPFEKVDEILRNGGGTQWDPVVIQAYIRCRDRLKAVRERGIGESLRDALDGALRHGQRAHEFASMEASML